MPPAVSIRRGFIAGLIAGAAVLAASYLITLATGLPSLIELVWDFAVGAIPASLFSTVLDSLKYAAKPLLLVGLIGLSLFLAGLLGIIYAAACGSNPKLLGYSRHRAWLVGAASGLPLCLGALAFGGPILKSDGWEAWLGVLSAVLAYAILQAEILARIDPLVAKAEKPEAADLLRRDLLVKGVAGLIVLSAGGLLLKVLLSAGQGISSKIRGSAKKLSSYITPNADFYYVSKNLSDPIVGLQTWRLEIKGHVANPYKLTLEELKSLPSVTQLTTLECISNEVGGDLIGNAVWKGVRLRDLLDKAGLSPDAIDVALYAEDEYGDSIPLNKAMDPSTLIAYEMNGEPLSHDHGAPARLVVPGIYGMKNVKWLTGVEVVAHDFKGFWQLQGWSDSAVIRTMSRIDTPGGGEQLGSKVTVAGVAFAGERGISKVEVSFDGVTWNEAILSNTESPLTWVLWTIDWELPFEKLQAIAVRAVDGRGALQESAVESSFPDGATGYHRIGVFVPRQ